MNICSIRNNKSVINERRQKLFALLTRGMKGYEIAKELNVDSATVSRDIKYLTAESQNYLNSLAKEWGVVKFYYLHIYTFGTNYLFLHVFLPTAEFESEPKLL